MGEKTIEEDDIDVQVIDVEDACPQSIYVQTIYSENAANELKKSDGCFSHGDIDDPSCGGFGQNSNKSEEPDLNNKNCDKDVLNSVTMCVKKELNNFPGENISLICQTIGFSQQLTGERFWSPISRLILNSQSSLEARLKPEKSKEGNTLNKKNPNNVAESEAKSNKKDVGDLLQNDLQQAGDKICNTEPQKLTNFLIENILRPEFGVNLKKRKRNDVSNVLENNLDQHHQQQPLNLRKQRNISNEKSRKTKTDEHATKTDSLWPAWVYCTRYSDRPSAGPRSRKTKKRDRKADEKRPRTAFTNDQLQRLKKEFEDNRYLTEQRRQDLARDLQLNESQIKIWFQNKRAKLKKTSGVRNPLAIHLMAQGLYNHAAVSQKN